jgi:hypothetical protein
LVSLKKPLITDITTIKAPTLSRIPMMETREMGLEVRYLKAMKNLYIPVSFQLMQIQEFQSPTVAAREGMPEKKLGCD